MYKIRYVPQRPKLTKYASDIKVIRQQVILAVSSFRVTHNGQNWFCVRTGLNHAKYTTDIESLIRQVF